jgi:hypothetical protein
MEMGQFEQWRDVAAFSAFYLGAIGALIFLARLRNMKTEDKAKLDQQDLCGLCMAWEDNQLDHEETVNFFQHLIDTGMAWSLQGMYGREATRLIEAGYCTRPGTKQVA